MGMSRVYSVPVRLGDLILQLRVMNLGPAPDVGTVIRYKDKLAFVVDAPIRHLVANRTAGTVKVRFLKGCNPYELGDEGSFELQPKEVC